MIRSPRPALLSRCALLCINGPLYIVDHKVGGIVRCQRHFGHGFSSRVQCMSPRRRLRANRERWRAQQVMRDYRRRTAADLAGVLALFGHCAVPGNAWTAAGVAHRFARDGAEAASAAEPAMRLCSGCPVIEECRQWASIDRYTGLAAGSSWVRGSEYDAATTINNSRPRVSA